MGVHGENAIFETNDLLDVLPSVVGHDAELFVHDGS
jgi:hypothetical protein